MDKNENTKTLCIRFNLLKNKDKAVWDILHSLDKSKWKSYSNAVINSVADFFGRQERLEKDPYFETREREEQFVAEIIAAVERSMDKEVPKFLSVCFGEILKRYSAASGMNNGTAPAVLPPPAAAVRESGASAAAEDDYSDLNLSYFD